MFECYECPAVGLDGPPLQFGVFFDTLETLEEVRTRRIRSNPAGIDEDQSSRTIDLDLLPFDDLVDDSLRLLDDITGLCLN